MLFFWAWRHDVMFKNQCTNESLRNIVFCSVIHKTPPKTNLLGLTSQSWCCKKGVHVYLFNFSSVLLLSPDQCFSVWVFAPAPLHSIVLTLPPVERGRVGLAGQVHGDHGDRLQASGTGFNFYSVESMVAIRLPYALASFSPCQLFPSPSHVPLKYNTEISSNPCTADSQRLHTKYIAVVYLCVLAHTH